MDSPQYFHNAFLLLITDFCFKPYYKWIVLNTYDREDTAEFLVESFKPYYKWIVLNTEEFAELVKLEKEF